MSFEPPSPMALNQHSGTGMDGWLPLPTQEVELLEGCMHTSQWPNKLMYTDPQMTPGSPSTHIPNARAVRELWPATERQTNQSTWISMLCERIRESGIAAPPPLHYHLAN